MLRVSACWPDAPSPQGIKAPLNAEFVLVFLHPIDNSPEIGKEVDTLNGFDVLVLYILAVNQAVPEYRNDHSSAEFAWHRFSNSTASRPDHLYRNQGLRSVPYTCAAISHLWDQAQAIAQPGSAAHVHGL